MYKLYQTIILLILTFSSQSVVAKNLVLIHGYLGSAHSWQQAGITQKLQHLGWIDAGIISSHRQGPQLLGSQISTSNQQFYRVNLWANSPLRIQAKQLADSLKLIPNQQDTILIAHSAGGLAARIVLSLGDAKNVTHLITIATPHLGTQKAIDALNITDIPFPFSIPMDIFAGPDYQELKKSRELLIDLLPERPGNLLHWLNHQPHPDIKYTSIIRSNGFSIGDELVAGFSQDMNNISALQHKSKIIFTNSDHFLDHRDAGLILSIINQ